MTPTAAGLLAELDGLGRDPRGGWSRAGFSPADPTGVSRAPSEGADEADVVAGVAALATVLRRLAS